MKQILRTTRPTAPRWKAQIQICQQARRHTLTAHALPPFWHPTSHIQHSCAVYLLTNQLARTYLRTPGLLELELALSSPCSLLDLGPLSSPQLACTPCSSAAASPASRSSASLPPSAACRLGVRIRVGLGLGLGFGLGLVRVGVRVGVRVRVCHSLAAQANLVFNLLGN